MSDVDESFLINLNDWRLRLAQNIYKNNKGKEFKYNNSTTKLSFSSSTNSKRSLELIKESTQRILNRLIIIRFTEDKSIINPNQLIWLNATWKDFKKGDLFFFILQNFFQKFHMIYSSKIFERGHICDQLEIDNEILSGIIRDLYEHTFLEFTFDILGSTYESYLSQELILEHGEIKLQLNQGSQKTGGIYYTPPYIINFILQNTVKLFLDDLFNECQKLLKDKNFYELSKRISDLQKIKILDPACGSGSFLIAAYNLIKGYISKIKELIFQNSNDKSEFFIEILSDIEKRILNDIIFGVDSDPQAAEITAVNLMLQTIKKGEKNPLILEDNIKIGNSLISEDETILKHLYSTDWKDIKNFIWEKEFNPILNDQKFSFIIGNPPYIPWNKIPFRKIFENGQYLDLKYECRPNHKDAQPNIYLFFLIRAINLVKNGKIGFIIPQEWRFENYARNFRNYLLEKSNSIQIIRFNPQLKVFKNSNRSTKKKIGTNSLILFLEITKNKTTDRELIEYYIDELEEEDVILFLADPAILEKNSIKTVKKFDELIDIPWVFALPQEEKLKRKIESLPDIINLTNLNYFYVKGGFQPPINVVSNYQTTSDVLSALTDKEKQYVFPVILYASDMQRYYLNRRDHYWIILNDIVTEMELRKNCPNLYNLLSKNLDTTLPEWWKFPNIRNFELIKKFNIKLLSPRTSSRNSFCIDYRKSVFKGTNTMIISLKLNPYYLIGILNSNLANFWYSKFGFEYHGEKTKKYEPQKVREYSIPIKKPPNKNIEKKIITLTKNLVDFKSKFSSNCADNSEVDKLDEILDDIIFSLYNLSLDEINLVRESK